MNLSIAVLAALDGVSYAALVFLVSVGLSLIFGVMRIVNVAHGSLYAYGAYAAATVPAAGLYWPYAAGSTNFPAGNNFGVGINGTSGPGAGTPWLFSPLFSN